MSAEAKPEEQTTKKPTRAEKEAAEAKEAASVPIKPPPEPRIKGVHVILPYLLMGSADVAVNKDELKYLGVKHIMNCVSEDVDNMFEDDFTYTSYAIPDTHEAEPNEFFEDSYNIIAKIKEDRSLIFVHDTEGKSIAPTMVLNYMMRSAAKQQKHLSLLQAVNFLGTKAPGIKVEDYLMAQLIEVEEELYDEASIKLKGGNRNFSSSRLGGRGGRGGRGGKGRRALEMCRAAA